jgi:hypothetical protein
LILPSEIALKPSAEVLFSDAEHKEAVTNLTRAIPRQGAVGWEL